MIRSSLQSSRTSRGRHAGPAEKFHLRSPDAWTATAARGLEMTALRAVTLRPATAREPRATPEVMLRAAILVVRSKSVRLLRRGKAFESACQPPAGRDPVRVDVVHENEASESCLGIRRTSIKS